MKLYREVKASDRLPEKDWEGVLILNSEIGKLYHHSNRHDVEAELSNGSDVIWLEPYNITEDELNNIIQPHAITLEHGEKAVKEIIEYLNGER